jgi:hypothetical protein
MSDYFKIYGKNPPLHTDDILDRWNELKESEADILRNQPIRDTVSNFLIVGGTVLLCTTFPKVIEFYASISKTFTGNWLDMCHNVLYKDLPILAEAVVTGITGGILTGNKFLHDTPSSQLLDIERKRQKLYYARPDLFPESCRRSP